MWQLSSNLSHSWILFIVFCLLMWVGTLPSLKSPLMRACLSLANRLDQICKSKFLDFLKVRLLPETYSCSANIFPVAKPMMPPPMAANIPILRPVRAMTGVPRHVATNSAPAMGTCCEQSHYCESFEVPKDFVMNQGYK